MLDQQKAELQTDEGTRLVVYDDGTGNPLTPGMSISGHPTIGTGRALDVHGISQAESDYLFNNDVDMVESVLVGYGWYQGLDPVRQGVMTNLAFNMGISGLLSFHLMIADLVAQNWIGAATQLKASRWYNQVQASRSSRLIAQLQTGNL